MSDTGDGERRAAELLRQWAAVREVLTAVWAEVRNAVRAACAFVDGPRKAAARGRWYEAQRVARTLSRHPDLAAMDGWMDRMYPGIP